jgi:hypothetical protein
MKAGIFTLDNVKSFYQREMDKRVKNTWLFHLPDVLRVQWTVFLVMQMLYLNTQRE